MSTSTAISRMLTVKPQIIENPLGNADQTPVGLEKSSLSRDEHLSHGRTAPCYQIRRLVSGHDPTQRRYIVVMAGEVFQAVVDESGYQAADAKHPSDALVFAGYMGTVADWENFTHGWQPILEDNPELADAEFVKKLMRWQGKWSDPRAVELMKVVTDNRAIGSIRLKLPYRDYRGVVLTHMMGGDENMYFFAWYAVLLQLVGIIRAHFPDATLDLFYDENTEQEPKVQGAYDALYKMFTEQFPLTAKILPRRPTPKSDSTFWPLRAADALAWNTHRDFLRQQKNKRFSNPLWDMLKAGAVCMDQTYPEGEVRDILVPNRMRQELYALKLESTSEIEKAKLFKPK